MLMKFTLCPSGGIKFSGNRRKTVRSADNTSNKNTQLSKRILNKMHKKHKDILRIDITINTFFRYFLWCNLGLK